MNKWVKKFHQIMLYGGLEKEQYHMISKDINEANRKSIVLLSTACMLVFLLRLNILRANIPMVNKILFFIAVFSFGGIALANKCVKDNRILVHISAYLFMIVYLGIGIGSSVGAGSIRERTTLYLVFIAVAPMLFALNSLELMSIVVSAEIIYLVMITHFQSAYPVYVTNKSNSLFFAISGLFLGIYMSNMKISGIYSAYMNLRMEEIKQLNEEISKSQEKLQEALSAAEYANRSKTAFLNSVSHDIRTPMNAIVGFTSLASAHIDDKEQVQNYLEKVTRSSQHLLALINDVLDMSRIESGKVKIEEKPIHILEVINDIQAIIQTGIDEKQQEFLIDTQTVINENILADKLRINQILLNLLSNAMKFTPVGGKIQIQIIQKPGASEGYADYEFHVKDNGIGMSEEFQKHIFEAFSREETAVVNNIQGTGLGMSITKNIVDMMNGTITVDSEEGKGTEFIVSLRFALNEKEEVPEERIKNQKCRNLLTDGQSKRFDESPSAPEKIVLDKKYFMGKTILVVEDNILNQELAEALLSEVGFKVEIAADGAEAVEKIEQASPGQYVVVLMDIQMPRMNGYEATRRIRNMADKQKAEIPIIAMTANAFAEDKKAALDAGMNNHIAKPIEINKLIEILLNNLIH